MILLYNHWRRLPAGHRTLFRRPAIDLPLFEGGRLRGNLHLREAEQREAATLYYKTLLRAWTEVDDAMTAYGQ